MRFLMYLCVISLNTYSLSGLPYPYNRDVLQINRSPNRSVMVHGYYGRPSQYNPEGAMTAFVSGETVATNSYLGGRYNPVQESEEEIDVKKGVHVAPQPSNSENLGDEEDMSQEVTLKPKIIPKRRPQRPLEEEEDDDKGVSWPFQLGKGIPSYSAFFPIMIGGYQGGQTRESGGSYPGSATAIANSFSTGKGGVASSHATAYGDPYMSALLRNGYNFKKKPVQKDDY